MTFLKWFTAGPAARGKGTHRKELRYQHLIGRLLPWLLRFDPPAGATDFLLDAVETSFALLPAEEVARVAAPPKRGGAEARFGNVVAREHPGLRSGI